MSSKLSNRVLITGASGQLGSELQRLKPAAIALGHADLDISSPTDVTRTLDEHRPDVVVNAAAYNAVDRAEQEPTKAFAVNADGPGNLATWCREHGALLVHVSTDYVFGQDRSRTEPYQPEDDPGPISQYGASKLAGEQRVRDLCAEHCIVRTCGLYSAYGMNFVKTMLALAEKRRELAIVDDQRCTPTPAAIAAEGIIDLIGADARGTFHLTCRGSTTWNEFAQAIFRITGRSIAVQPISSAEYGAAAARPTYSVLDCTATERVLGRELPDWERALAEFFKSQTAK